MRIEQRMETPEDLLHSGHLGINVIPLGLRDVDDVGEIRGGADGRGPVGGVVGIARGRIVVRRDRWGDERGMRRGGSGDRGGRYRMFESGRGAVGTVEIALDAIAARDVAVAANFAGAASQASLALARAATDRIRRHRSLHPEGHEQKNRGIGRSALQERVDNGS